MKELEKAIRENYILKINIEALKEELELTRSKTHRLSSLYITDKASGKVHRIGTDPHDSMSVDENGVVSYRNLQNGDGASGDGDSELAGYRFVESDCGEVEGNV